MTNQYHLKDEFGSSPFLNFRYEGKEVTFRSLKGIDAENDSRYLSTEHDVITDWSTVCREALSDDEYKESETPCWEGHYEQFGLVMLNLANMCRFRKTYDNRWSPYFDRVLPSSDLHEIIYSGYGGTEDRIFYRAWFTLLGHPDFLKSSLLGFEALNYKNTELQLLISFTDLNHALLAKKNS
jgi:hypothetical protein